MNACIGDADGLGHMRKGELVKSALHLGVRDESHVTVLDDPSVLLRSIKRSSSIFAKDLRRNFPDSMTRDWDPELISKLLVEHFKASKDIEANTNSLAPQNILITFDAHGISSHPNHKSLYRGALHYLKTLPSSAQGSSATELYTLRTTSLPRKYLSFLDAPFTILSNLLSITGPEEEFPGKSLVFVNSIREWRRSQKAMTHAHVSQMRWFRWGWIGLSRYMVVNDLGRVDLGN